MILFVYLGYGTFYPAAVLFSPKSVVGRGLELPNRGTSEKKLLRLHRGTRPLPYKYVACDNWRNAACGHLVAGAFVSQLLFSSKDLL